MGDTEHATLSTDRTGYEHSIGGCCGPGRATRRIQ
jgi:hypothetical protein